MPYRHIGLICPSESVHFLVGHLKELSFSVCALWTEDPELTIHAAAEFEIPFAASRPDEVLLRKEVQMIIITGRPQLHSQIAVKALGIGKHVLCDSPVTMNRSEAVKMVQAAHYYPQLLALVGYGLRHLEVFRKAKELIDGGYIGTPIACECSVRTGSLLLADRYDWRWEWSMGGGVLNLVGCHVIDIISYLTQRRAIRAQGLVKCSGLAVTESGNRSTDVSGSDIFWKKDSELSSAFTNANCDHSSVSNGGTFRRVNADDFSSFLLKCDSDFVATVTLNALSGSKSDCSSSSQSSPFYQRISISGTEGRIEIFNHELRATKFHAACPNGSVQSDGPTSGELRYVGVEGNQLSKQAVPSMCVDGFRALVRLLADTLPLYEHEYVKEQPKKLSTADPPIPWQAGCLAPLASFEDAQYVRAVIDAVRHSSEKGDWVKVDLLQFDNTTRRK